MSKYVAVKVVTADTSDDLAESILMKDLYDAPSKPGKETDYSNPSRRILGYWSQWKTQMYCHCGRADELARCPETSIHGLFQPKVA